MKKIRKLWNLSTLKTYETVAYREGNPNLHFSLRYYLDTENQTPVIPSNLLRRKAIIEPKGKPDVHTYTLETLQSWDGGLRSEFWENQSEDESESRSMESRREIEREHPKNNEFQGIQVEQCCKTNTLD